jgi:hypothetical protein
MEPCVASAIDFAHPALADGGKDLVGAESVADGERHMLDAANSIQEVDRECITRNGFLAAGTWQRCEAPERRCGWSALLALSAVRGFRRRCHYYRSLAPAYTGPGRVGTPPQDGILPHLCTLCSREGSTPASRCSPTRFIVPSAAPAFY